ncbi:MAG: COX15/CtaA family protein [Candidatus Binatota bacterium]
MKVEVGLRVHRLALLTAVATLLLLFIGGLVTSKGAGLAVPDWPTTFGHNMFLYPWSEMIGDIFYEHSHRLVASGVGLLTILLAFSLWFYERRRWLRWLGAAALTLVIVQGIIGGLRVVLLEETLAILHACLAQAFFALTASLALFTSQEWAEEPRKIELADTGRPFDRLRAVRELEPLQRLCVLTTAMIYLQGVLGAVVRFTGAGIHLHLLFAALVALHVTLLAARILRFHSNQAKLFRPAVLLGGLLILQLVLGLGSYLVKFTSIGTLLPALPVVILRTTHVVTGALMLVTGLLLTLRSYRLLAHPHPLLGRQLLSEQIPA